MKTLILALLGLNLVLGHPQAPVESARFNDEERKADQFVTRAEAELEKAAQEYTVISWAYATNITDYNEKRSLDYQKKFDALSLKLGREAQKLDTNKINDQDLRRKVKDISLIGTSVLQQKDLDRYNKITNDMEKIYSTAKVPSYKDKSKKLSLDPGITKILAESRDPKELEYYWEQWRAQTGAKFRDMYKEYVDYTNKAARLNGFRDGTEMKTHAYESDTFVQEMDATWQGLKPLYEQLHAYVRHRLMKIYGNEVMDEEGPIPEHLLGNMWAQSWNNLAKELKPFPDKPSIEVDDEMKRQGWTAKIMFEKADDFFQSIGLEPMNDNFWKNSVIEKPDDGRELVCHASAWDFHTGDDWRIKQCTQVTEEDFVTVNHEMGHIQYFMRYRNQSYLFRSGANPGFHEGVADILSLAVGTASYYQRLGLLGNDVDIADEETNINILLSMALQRLAFMPFGYLVDKYRWDLYSGWAKPEDMNCHWAKLRAEIQGVKPPNRRNENQFDPGSKYHIAANVGYVRYFTAFVYEFQFYRSLCLVSGQYDPDDPAKPLHHCNFYGSKVAGDKLVEMLKLGASKPWKDAMEVMTGQRDMSTAAFREYFKPLEDWLVKENRKNNVNVGWKMPELDSICEPSKTAGSSLVLPHVLMTLILAAINFVPFRF